MIVLHPILTSSLRAVIDPTFSLDFADQVSKRTPLFSLPYVLEPATSPLLTTVNIIIQDFPWSIKIFKPSGIFIYAVLGSIRDCLALPITFDSPDCLHLEQTERDAITQAWELRVTKASDESFSKAMRRVDFLKGATALGGLSVAQQPGQETAGSQDEATLELILLDALNV